MVDSSVHSTKTGVELADVVRRFGPKYTSQYGHLMMPSQKRALPHSDQQCPNSCRGPNARHLSLQGPRHRHLADHAARGCRVPAAILAARPATRFSQGPILRTLASLETPLGKSGVAPPDPPEAGRHGLPAENRGPARSVGPTHGTLRAPSRWPGQSVLPLLRQPSHQPSRPVPQLWRAVAVRAGDPKRRSHSISAAFSHEPGRGL
jgi:hypothetical protein